MNIRFRPSAVATALALALLSTGTLAFTLVAGPGYSPNHGQAGTATVYQPKLTVSDDVADVLNFHSIAAWNFYVDWDQAVLDFDPNAATISFGGGAHAYSGALSGVVAHLATIGTPAVTSDNQATAAADGYYELHWESGLTFLDLGSEIEFTGAYTIKAGAAAGDYVFGFARPGGSDSEILDDQFEYFSYNTVSAGEPAMVITVDAPAPTPAPEPASIALLLGGLAAYLGAARLRRRNC